MYLNDKISESEWRWVEKRWKRQRKIFENDFAKFDFQTLADGRCENAKIAVIYFSQQANSSFSIV